MKIAQIVDKFLPITESWIYSQVIGLQELGVDSEAFCHKITNQESHPFSPIHSYKDIPEWKTNYYRLKGKILKEDGATLFWDNIIKKGNFDLIHSHFGWAAQKGIDLAIKNNLPHIATFYGADVSRDPFDKNKRDYQEKLPLIFDYSKRILCTSEFLKNRLIKLGTDESKTIVWRPAIKIDVPKVEKKSDEIFRIISVGRFIDWKGQKYLIKALPEIISKNPNFRVDFIGTGPELQKCKDIANKLGVSIYINFLGKLPKYSDVIKKMAEADIIVHASYTAKRGVNDALGVVLAEAALCKTPAIASDCGGMPEIVINGKTGLLAEEKNSEDLAEKIKYYINNPDVLTEHGGNAEKHCRNLFDPDTQLRKLKSLIH